MITRTSVARRLPALGLLLAACVTEPNPNATTSPNQASMPASPASSDEPTTTVIPTPAPTEPAPVEPAPGPVLSNATPSTLSLAFHGRCQNLGTSLVDGHTLVHYRHEPVGWVHRMDEHGAIAQMLPLEGADELGGMGSREITKVLGHWPEPLVMLELYLLRSDDVGILHRWTNEGWKRIEEGRNTMFRLDAWAWRDGSILAWNHLEEDEDRYTYDQLAVVRGEPKAPSIETLGRRLGCESGVTVNDIDVRGDLVAATVSCWGNNWIATATDGGNRWDTTSLPRDMYGYELYLDDRGTGFLKSRFPDKLVLLRWSDGEARVVDLPASRMDQLVVAGDGKAWLVAGSTLWRFTGSGWEAVSIPKGRRIVQAAGLEHDTPWLLRQGGAVSMQTADGTWHDVTVPPTPDRDDPPVVDAIHVVGPGDAWIRAKYSVVQPPSKPGKRGKKQTMRALYTTRDAPVPLQCGTERAAAGTGT